MLSLQILLCSFCTTIPLIYTCYCYFLLPSGPSKQYEWGVVEEAKIPVHQLVGQRGKGTYCWDNKIHYVCSCSTSLSTVKSLKACLRKAGVPAKRFCVYVLPLS